MNWQEEWPEQVDWQDDEWGEEVDMQDADAWEEGVEWQDDEWGEEVDMQDAGVCEEGVEWQDDECGEEVDIPETWNEPRSGALSMPLQASVLGIPYWVPWGSLKPSWWTPQQYPAIIVIRAIPV